MSNGVDEWTWTNLWILLLPLFSVSKADVTQGHHSMGKWRARFQHNKSVSSITILTWDNKQSLAIQPWKDACSASRIQKRLCKRCYCCGWLLPPGKCIILSRNRMISHLRHFLVKLFVLSRGNTIFIGAIKFHGPALFLWLNNIKTSENKVLIALDNRGDFI